MINSPKPGVFVFCERITEEAVRWKKWHEDALRGHELIEKGEKMFCGQTFPRILKTGNQRKRERLDD